MFVTAVKLILCRLMQEVKPQVNIPWGPSTHAVSHCPEVFSLFFSYTSSILKELSNNLSVTTAVCLQLEGPGSELSLLKQ